MKVMSTTLKTLALPALLCAALACRANEPAAVSAEPDSPVSALPSLPKDRCPAPRLPNPMKFPSGDHSVVVRLLIKADGSVDEVRIVGRIDRDFKRAIVKAFDGYRCQPTEADQEYTMTLRTRVTSDYH